MNLNQRERTIAIVVGVLVGLWLLDYVAISPLLAQRDDLLHSIDTAQSTLRDGRDLVARRHTLDAQLANNVKNGLQRDQDAATSQLLNNLNQWAGDCGLALPALKPSGAAQTVTKPGGRAGEKEKAFLKIGVRVTGAGNLVQITRFMYRIQTASIPVRITDFSISSKKDGTDDLEINMNISTLFLTADAGTLIVGIGPATHATSAPASQPRGQS